MVVALALAWRLDGSILAPDWLPYAALIALVAATVLFSSACRPPTLPLVCAAFVTAFGLWTGISAIWSPTPALARNEFLLSVLYGFSLILPALTPQTAKSCRIALTGVTFALGASAVAIALAARFGADPGELYADGRLTAPVSYVNAQGAFFLVGLWPALVLAAHRGSNAVIRALSLGFAAAMLAGWLSTQSKGAGGRDRRLRRGGLRGRSRAVAAARSGAGGGRARRSAVPRADGRLPGRRRRRGGAACGWDRARALRGRRRGGIRLRPARQPADRASPGAQDRGDRGGGRRDARGRCRRRHGRRARRRPARVRLGEMGELQAAADDRDGKQPPAQPRLQPLRLLARQPRRLRRPSGGRYRRTRLRAALPAGGSQHRDAGPGPLAAARRPARNRHRRLRAAHRLLRPGHRRRLAASRHRRRSGGARSARLLLRARIGRLDLDVPGHRDPGVPRARDRARVRRGPAAAASRRARRRHGRRGRRVAPLRTAVAQRAGDGARTRRQFHDSGPRLGTAARSARDRAAPRGGEAGRRSGAGDLATRARGGERAPQRHRPLPARRGVRRRGQAPRGACRAARGTVVSTRAARRSRAHSTT